MKNKIIIELVGVNEDKISALISVTIKRSEGESKITKTLSPEDYSIALTMEDLAD